MAPTSSLVHDRFSRRASATPDAPAVVCVDETLTYAALDRRANQLAHRLLALGVGAGALVAIALERSADMYVGLLAVLKVGAAYLPIERDWPEEWVGRLMAEARPNVVLTHDRWPSQFLTLAGGGLTTPLNLDDERRTIGSASMESPSVAVLETDVACVMYTSGSSGIPRGVMIPHRAVVSRALLADYCDLGPDEVLFQFAPLAFDASTFEIWGCLLNGGRLEVPSDAAPSLRALGQEIRKRGVTTVWLTAGLFQQMVTHHLDDLLSVRQLLTGGDVVPVDSARRYLRAIGHGRLINGYGPTENTVFSCCCSMGDDSLLGASVPIGRPIAGSTAYVVDAAGNLAATGEPGELLVGGIGLALGYLHQPALTADRFVPNPFAAGPAERLYRTGDVVRWRADGNLEFVGRRDRQVKIRGFRVEPDALEAALCRHPDVAAAAVVVTGEGAAEKQLIAHVVAQPGCQPSAAHLRAFLLETQPREWVPTRVVVRDCMPLTSRGKWDRRHLGDHEDPLATTLAAMWTEAVGEGSDRAHDGFLESGGDSLKAMRLAGRIQEECRADISVRELLAVGSFDALVRLVSDRVGSDGTSRFDPVPIHSGRTSAPLSSAQQRLWFLDQFSPGAPAYHVPLVCLLSGPLDSQRLQQSLEVVVSRHGALRTTFSSEDGIPRQDVHATPLMVWQDTTAEGLAHAWKIVSDDARRPFDLALGPLLRATVIRLGDNDHLLAVVIHHIVFDRWSAEILWREWTATYSGRDADATGDLVRLPGQYVDYVQWECDQRARGGIDASVDHWRQRLHGAPMELAWPPGPSLPGLPSSQAECLSWSLPSGLASSIIRWGRRDRVTPFVTLLSAFQWLLHDVTGQDDLLVGYLHAGRMHPSWQRPIGFFVNTLVSRSRRGRTLSRLEHFRRTSFETQQDLEHAGVPFDLLVRALGPTRRAHSTPLVQALFDVETSASELLRFGAATGRPAVLGTGAARFDLSVVVAPADGSLRVSWEYRCDRFAPDTIAGFHRQYQALLEALVENAEGSG